MKIPTARDMQASEAALAGKSLGGVSKIGWDFQSCKYPERFFSTQPLQAAGYLQQIKNPAAYKMTKHFKSSFHSGSG